MRTSSLRQKSIWPQWVRVCGRVRGNWCVLLGVWCSSSRAGCGKCCERRRGSTAGNRNWREGPRGFWTKDTRQCSGNWGGESRRAMSRRRCAGVDYDGAVLVDFFDEHLTNGPASYAWVARASRGPRYGTQTIMFLHKLLGGSTQQLGSPTLASDGTQLLSIRPPT